MTFVTKSRKTEAREAPTRAGSGPRSLVARRRLLWLLSVYPAYKVVASALERDATGLLVHSVLLIVALGALTFLEVSYGRATRRRPSPAPTRGR
ncbi:MAG: hypothetical protein Kow0069_11300 [Promethearchaeota archaeon]